MAPVGRIAILAVARGVHRLAPVLAVALAACATPAPPPAPAVPGPAGAPTARVLSDFGALRRCIGDLLVDNGTQDLVLVVEAAPDDRGRGNDAAREALVASIGEMAQRSRAIRFAAAPGADATTVRAALRRSPGALTLELAVLAADRHAVPGGAASHSIALVEGGAELREFGTLFKAARDPAGGDRAALQVASDVAAAEVVGRLARLPYWSCFGAAADDPAVAAEVQNWYDTLAARPAELITFFQRRLRTRQLYDGPADGRVNPAFKEAVAGYREALGLAREPKLSLDFFRASLGADLQAPASKMAAGAPAAPAARPEPAPALASPAAPPAPQPLELQLTSENARPARGEALHFTVRPSRDAFVYCFHQDEQRRIRRFFPNRFKDDARVPAGNALRLPGDMRFEIVMNTRGTPETVACFATESDVRPRLPARLAAADFSPLPLATLEQLRSAFAAAASGAVAQDTFEMRAR